ncbi:MAG: hypothetical protein KAH44_07380 [Oricola sp.]|uniref:hypothetical protein n=1 Tax=Hyphococcus sp. TaxID=2038636 RepID=UPI00320BEAA0|nr:hypothetical protein [Oricola sp.]
MNEEALLNSLKYRTNRLVRRLLELDSGERTVFFHGEDVTAADANELRHRIRENLTIIKRLSASPDSENETVYDLAS